MERNGIHLVNFLAEAAEISTAVARRAIIEGGVRVNGEVVEYPGTKLGHEMGDFSVVEYDGETFPHYP